MASDVDICNMALAHVGSDAIVVSIDPPDGSAEAGHCSRFYRLARSEMIDAFNYTFAKTRVQLAEVANPSLIWAYAYEVPSDCMNAMRVLQVTTVQQFAYDAFSSFITADVLQLFTERGSADFEIEDGVLLTNEPEAVLLYSRDITDPAVLSPSFTVALSYLLASFLAGPIIKGREGATTGATLRTTAMNLAKAAQANDAANSSERAEHIPAAIQARW